MLSKYRLVFLGPPGAGKGTIAKQISKSTGVVHISTGDILRKEIKNKSTLGMKAQEYVHDGNLVPDELVANIVGKRLEEDDCRYGFILDGFPRTLNQAEILKKKNKESGVAIDAVILFDADRELILKRLTSRLVCRKCAATYNKLYIPPRLECVCDECGGELYQRKDDSPETVEERLSVYEKLTAPLIEFYEKENLLIKVNSNGNKDMIVEILIKELS